MTVQAKSRHDDNSGSTAGLAPVFWNEDMSDDTEDTQEELPGVSKNGTPEGPDLTPEGIQAHKAEVAKEFANALADLTMAITKLPPSTTKDLACGAIEQAVEHVSKIFNRPWVPKGKIYLMTKD